ncbi:BrnT family toxin [Mesorhizobium sp. RCC_202]|uniref:BrnT family toxin n=1 Tax=Mesorhizobium sp. RCC_202 TaxID=3239222 RepID=UPI003524C0E8
MMRFEWDAAKARANKAKHGVDFELAPEFDFANAVIAIDDREIYGEERLVAKGDRRLCRKPLIAPRSCAARQLHRRAPAKKRALWPAPPLRVCPTEKMQQSPLPLLPIPMPSRSNS